MYFLAIRRAPGKCLAGRRWDIPGVRFGLLFGQTKTCKCGTASIQICFEVVYCCHFNQKLSRESGMKEPEMAERLRTF